jgi:hypothetical protein
MVIEITGYSFQVQDRRPALDELNCERAFERIIHHSPNNSNLYTYLHCKWLFSLTHTLPFSSLVMDIKASDVG